ncbi:MAG TPA: PPOX class F420-dependent oxidoreductase [Micromonosporaceae bacterium]|nr:PPOX class F420-dependent oxidoreductase [Micromonosporaceae bacterium]
MTSALDRLATAQYVSLTTYRRDGTSVPTAVWIAGDGEALYVWTAADTGKVKRIRRCPDVTVAPSDPRGRVSGDAVRATAEICDAAGTEHTRDLLRRKYGWLGRALIRLSLWRRGRDGTVGLRLTLRAD